MRGAAPRTPHADSRVCRVHEQRAWNTSSSSDEVKLGRAHLGDFVATTARAQGGTAPVFVPDFDGIRVDLTTCSTMPGDTFRGFFERRQCPRRGSPIWLPRKDVCGAFYYDAFSIVRLCDVVYWPRQPGSSSTSAPNREEQTPARLRTRSGFQWAESGTSAVINSLGQWAVTACGR